MSDHEAKRWLESEARRIQRWDRIHQAFLLLCSLAAGAAWIAFDAYREWVIWSR